MRSTVEMERKAMTFGEMLEEPATAMLYAPVMAQVKVQLVRQIERWGLQGHPQTTWLAILGEEFGEVAKAICEVGLAGRGESEIRNVLDELVQVAAVAMAMHESLCRCGFGGAA